MNKTFALFLALLLSASAALQAQKPKTAVEELGLQGAVKTLWESHGIRTGTRNNYVDVPSAYEYNRCIHFDRSGRKTAEEWYINRQMTDWYDEFELLHSRWTFHYDAAGRMDTCTWLDADSTLLQRWTYRYNPQGKEQYVILLDAVFSDTIYYLHKLDARGQKIQSNTHHSRDDYSYPTERYRYDNRGNRIEIQQGGEYTDEHGKQQWVAEWECTYRYDARNRLIHKSSSGEYDTDAWYEYDHHDRLVACKQGVFDDFGRRLTTYAYDSQGNLLKQNTEVLRNELDERRKAQSDRLFTAIEPEKCITYRYDYRLDNDVLNWNTRVETFSEKESYITYRNWEFYED